MSPVLRLRAERFRGGGSPTGLGRWELREDAILGRGLENTICLAEAGLARRHARFELRGERWWIVDLRSQSGCFLEGRRVDEVALAHGDRLHFGWVRVTVSLSDGPEPVPALDLLDAPARGEFDRSVVFQRAGRQLVLEEETLLEQSRVADDLLLDPTPEQSGLRPWRPADPHGAVDRRQATRPYLAGVDARQLVARLAQLSGVVPGPVANALIAGIAGALQPLNGLGSVEGDDVLITWSGEVLVTIPPGQIANEDLRARELGALIHSLDPLAHRSVDSLPSAAARYGPEAPEVLAAFLEATFPWWRRHQLAWLEEAALLALG